MKNDPIVQIGDEVLRKETLTFDLSKIGTSEFEELIKKMFEVLSKEEQGVALAAPQIGISERIFIVSPKAYQAEEKNIGELVFINPAITKSSSKKSKLEEGCLSVRGKYGNTIRSNQVTVETYDKNGNQFTVGCSGLIAQIVQHEIDHLNGILFIDHAENVQDIEDEK